MSVLRSTQIVIAGTGVAAGALACQLLGRGCAVTIVAGNPPRSRGPVIEALPHSSVHLFAETGLRHAFLAADPITVDGFDNQFNDTPRLLVGTWTHLNRTALARHCLQAAVDRGARVVHGFTQLGGGIFAVVDATGRAARHSRPIRRTNPATATIFTSRPPSEPRPARVIRTSTGWAYRIDHRGATTTGVITDRHPVDTLDTNAANRLGVGHAERAAVHTCPVQWALEPIEHRRIAIGDAALALNPLAGQGVRFALTSALAAAAVIGSWIDGHEEPYITSYYDTFVDSARTRHLTTLSAILDDPTPAPTPDAQQHLNPQSAVTFTAKTVTTGQIRDGRIVAETAIQLPDGGLTRYLGNIDLMLLRDATGHSATLAQLHRTLARRVGPHTANTVISWAVHKRLLAVSQAPSSLHHDRRNELEPQ